MISSAAFYRIVIAGLLIFSYGCSVAITPTEPLQKQLPPPQVFTTELPQVILPSLVSETPTTVFIKNDVGEFGVEISNLNVDFAMIQALGAKWVRYNGLLWSDLEPVEGQIAWDKLASIEEDLKKAQETGLKFILIVRSTPPWAQNHEGVYCGQVQAEKFIAFGSFLAQLIARYSVDPFNVHYWELWNEPDVDPSLVSTTHPFGCWGDQSDVYYGGEYFGEMLKAVAPLMRAADPTVKIISGGIILDCDPTNPGAPGRCKVGYELPPRFAEGFLRSGGGSYIDFFGFHGGPPYEPSTYSPILSVLNWANWQARGGVIAGKENYLHELMAAYNTAIPLFMTETSYACPESWTQCNPVSPEFFQKQAEYGAWLAVRNYAENINTIWYTFNGPGWRNGGLLDKDQNPRPVYISIQTALRKISDSAVVRSIDEYAGLSGYEFQSQQQKFYFLAPIAENPPQWAVPENVAQAMDIYGQPIPLESLSPLVSPVFIDIR